MTWLGRLLILPLVLLCACAPKVDPDSVVLWTAFEGKELETLRRLVSDYETAEKTKVQLLKVPFANFQQKVLVAAPAGQGPDLLIGPHDWLGLLQTAELLAPAPTEIISTDDDSFYDIAKRCVTFDGTIYSVPMMMECVVLARNTELCPERPETLEQLVASAQACSERNPELLGFAYELNDFYFTGAFLAGFGADFLAPFSQLPLDLDRLNFATPEGVEGARWVSNLARRSGAEFSLVPLDMKNDIAVELFLKGRLGMMLCGPWNVGAVRDSGVAYALDPLPRGPKQNCSPFVGVTGVMMSRYSADKPGVRELMAHLASPEVTATLCQTAARSPARHETAHLLKSQVSDPVVARDLELFAQAAQNGTPMPNHPAVGATFWAAMKGAFELIASGQVEPDIELQSTTERVRAKIRFMTD